MVSRRHAQSSSVRFCGINLGRWGSTSNVKLIVDCEGAGAWRGPLNCWSVWACPSCAYIIGQARAAEASEVLRLHLQKGGGAYLVTLTLPHDTGDNLKPMRQNVARAWRDVISGAPWLRWKERIGLVGQVRALECTHGPNGWHPHLHVVFLTGRWLEDLELAALQDYLARRWGDRMVKTGYRRPAPEYGVTIQRGQHAGWYVAKLGLARELAGGAVKVGRAGHRSPLEILRDLGSYRLEADRLLWIEWQVGMYGARQLTWSKGLKELYQVPEKTDAELGEEEQDPEPIEVLELAADDWWRVVNRELLAEQAVELAEAIFSSGADAHEARRQVRALLESGIHCRLSPVRPP